MHCIMCSSLPMMSIRDIISGCPVCNGQRPLQLYAPHSVQVPAARYHHQWWSTLHLSPAPPALRRPRVCRLRPPAPGPLAASRKQTTGSAQLRPPPLAAAPPPRPNAITRHSNFAQKNSSTLLPLPAACMADDAVAEFTTPKGTGKLQSMHSQNSAYFASAVKGRPGYSAPVTLFSKT